MDTEGMNKSNEEFSQLEIAKKVVLARLEAIKPGIKWDDKFIECMALLEGSKVSLDSKKVGIGMVNVFKEIAKRNSSSLSEAQLADIQLTGEIHDVGKSGPFNAELEEKRAIIRLFEAKNLTREDIVENAVREKLFIGDKAGADSMLFILKKYGVDVSDTMLKCWRRHAFWGAEIFKECCKEVPESITLPAILHHIDNGEEYNFTNTPIEEIPEDMLTRALALGQLEKYADALRQRIIIAVDKYEAQTRRIEASHTEAIDWIKKDISKKFPKDALLKLIIEVMEEMGKEKIFNDMAEQL